MLPRPIVTLGKVGRVFVLSSSVLLLPAAATAQSAISGLVTDSTGAVLPGVTVEAASPALIEGTRAVSTDNQGRYTIEALRPGRYRVTFTLSGFTTVIREGIDLAADFTAPVNVQMRVGSVEESVTVSGESPIVDVQRTSARRSLSREVLDALPTGRSWAMAGIVLPGVTATAPDVGGVQGNQQTYLSVHGSAVADGTLEVDGLRITGGSGSGSVLSNYVDDGSFQEMVYSTSGGGTAESQASGLRINMIPKEGGNRFSGTALALYSDNNFYSQNHNADLERRGLRAPGELVRLWDYNFGVGGPLMRDRLWFFNSNRIWGADQTIPDSFDRAGNQTVDDNLLESYLLRLTYQVSARNKISAYYNRTPRTRGHADITAGQSLEASRRTYAWTPYAAHAKWTSTVTDKLLVEGGLATNLHNYGRLYQLSVKPTDIARRDVVLGTLTHAAENATHRLFAAHQVVGTATYVTGSYTLKAGIQRFWGHFNQRDFVNADLIQEYREGVPFQVTVYNTPIDMSLRNYREYGLYVQGSRKIQKLTIDSGIRYDRYAAWIPAQTSPAGRFVAARNFASIDLPEFANWSPRFGVAYDLFGNAKTGLKFSVGRYLQQQASGFPALYNPLALQGDARTWTDPNKDDIAQDSELGPSSNARFGQALGRNTPDPNLQRQYNFLYQVGVDHQLSPTIGLSANYYRRDYKNLAWTDNLETTHADYTAVSIPDPRGNGQTITVYNLSRSKLGAVRNFDTISEQNTQWYNGYDVSLNKRFSGGGMLLAAIASGITQSRTCEVDNPNSLRFCDQGAFDVPWRTQYKVSGSYPLPVWDLSVSAVLQSLPGAARTVTYRVARTEIPQLTVASLTLPLTEPGSLYQERLNQLDLRFTKLIRYRTTRIAPQLAIFNVASTPTVLSTNNAFGSELDRVREILTGRIVRFGVQVDF